MRNGSLADSAKSAAHYVEDGFWAVSIIVLELSSLLAGTLAGAFRGTLLLKAFALQNATKLTSKEGRREVVFGRHGNTDLGPNKASQEADINSGLPRILVGQPDGQEHRDIHDQVGPHAPITPDSKPNLGKHKISDSALSSPTPSSPKALSKPALTDEAAEAERKALDVMIPAIGTKPKHDKKPAPSADDGELPKSLDLPEIAIPVPPPFQRVPPPHASAFEPVIYESDPPQLEERPKAIPAAGYESTLSTPGVTGHVVEFTDDSTPETEPRGKHVGPEDPYQLASPRSSGPDSPRDSLVLAASPLSTPRTQSNESSLSAESSRRTPSAKKQKPKGVKGAFRKIKKALSNN